MNILTRHRALRDALVWATPALILAIGLRAMFLSYSPYAYWGADSRSYYDFAHKLFDAHAISLNEKRRVLYPILLALLELLPGSILRWLAPLQHAFGVATLVPLAYIVRKTCVHWRWLVVPVTGVYAMLPIVLWYEHELLAETLFFALIVWAFAGWVAWVKATLPDEKRKWWWWFFVPFALLILVKPSARFYWPGICLGLLAVAAWRVMTLRQIVAVLGLMVITLFIGSKKQGAWLLYVASFPLTRLETSLHAEYKSEIADMVRYYRAHIDAYYDLDEEPFEFLRSPDRQEKRPLWRALDDDEKRQARIYMQLALEGITARPDLFLYMGVQRFIASANISSFKEFRFSSRYLPERFQNDYEDAIARLAQGKPTPIPRILGMPPRGPLPPYEQVAQRFAPRKDSLAESVVTRVVSVYQRGGDLVSLPDPDDTEKQSIKAARPTFLGWWLLIAMALSLLLPQYRTTFGVWVVATVGALLGVFCVSQMNPRYFGSAWPVFVPLLALPIDVLISAMRWRTR